MKNKFTSELKELSLKMVTEILNLDTNGLCDQEWIDNEQYKLFIHIATIHRTLINVDADNNCEHDIKELSPDK